MNRVDQRVLRQCVRAGLFEESDLRLGRDGQRCDWHAVARAGREHGVSPLIERAVDDTTPIPAAVLSTLREHRTVLTRRNLRYLQEVATLTAAFRREGIDVVPYRGPVIAELVYGNVGHRAFGDLDFLVSRADIPAARSVLLERGYEPRYLLESTDELTPSQEWAYVHAERDYPFQRPDDGIEAELHWRVVSHRFPSSIGLETVWDRRSTVQLAGTDVAVLGSEDRLLTCCVHGTRHRWERLSWICDVAAQLQTQSFDWDAIDARARTHNCERMVYLGVAVAHDVLDAPLPETVRQRIADDPVIESLRTTVRAHLFDRTTYWYPDMRLYQSRTLSRYRDKATFWLGWAFKPNRADIEAVSLPRAFVPLYAAVRPFRLARTAVDRLVSTVTGSTR